MRSGTLNNGRKIAYAMNYSADRQRMAGGRTSGPELLSGRHVGAGEPSELEPWGIALIEYDD